MGVNIALPPLCAQKFQIGPGALAAGDHDQIGITRDRLPGADHGQRHPRFQLQRVKIVEIGNARQGEAGDPIAAAAGFAAKVQRIFGGKPVRPVKPRHHAVAPPAGAGLDQMITIVEQAGVAAKLVHRKPPDHRGIARVQHCLGPHQLRDHPAAVDVADQHHRHRRRAGKAHVGNVALPQIDLCRAARAFDNHQIATRAQPVERLQNRGQQLPFQAGIVPCPHRRQPLALHNHLRAKL